MRNIIVNIFVMTLALGISRAQTNSKEINLIINGDFEGGRNNFLSNYKYGIESVSPGEYAIVNDASEYNHFFFVNPHPTLGKGNYLVVDVDDQKEMSFWCTKIKAQQNTTYKFYVAAANIHAHGIHPPELRLTINNQQIGSTYVIKDLQWKEFKWEWESKNRDSVTVCLQNINYIMDGSDLAVDDLKMIKLKGECPYLGDTIKNLVHFPFNESTLTEFSSNKLSKIVELLDECPEVKVKILSHADYHGTNTFNTDLSVKRAETVKSYLSSKGIASERILLEAFGEKQLIYHGSSFKEQVKNRRVEFLIVE